MVPVWCRAIRLSGETGLKQAARKIRFFLYATFPARGSGFRGAVFPVWPGWIRHPILAGSVIRRGGHSVEGWEAGPEAVRISQGACVGFEVVDAFRGHENLNAVEALFGLPFSITRLLVGHA